MPPSSGMTVPLMYAAPGEARNATVSHTSTLEPSRPIGVRLATIVLIASGSGARDAICANKPVSHAEGDTTFTRTWSGACSIAACLARLTRAPFDAQYAA